MESGYYEDWPGNDSCVARRYCDPSSLRSATLAAVRRRGCRTNPEVRIRRDLLAQFFDAPAEGPIAELKQAIHELNQLAEARLGAPVYAKLDPMHAQSIRVLRIPPNASTDAFAQQVRSLAILVVDHLNSGFLKAMQAPTADGSLNRLALLIRDLAHIDEVAAKDLIAGLYAAQAIRTNMTAHRTGQKALDALGRAGIDIRDLPAGFVKLVGRATASIRRLAEVLATVNPPSKG
jgi:hypothetical protein